MIDAMPRPRPPHLHRETTRHGRVVWFVRVGHGPRTRLRGAYGTPAFQTEYEAALRGERPSAALPQAVGTLAWLVSRYREVDAWTNLSPATRAQRATILRQILATAGNVPIARVTGQAVEAGIERRAATPTQARHYLATVRGLFRWAARAQHVAIDPTLGLKPPRRRRTAGFPAWTAEDIAAYVARWPIGTRERIWLDVLRFTGLRRGDAVLLGRQHVREGIIQITTEKTGERVTILLRPELAATIAAGPVGQLRFIELTKESFGNAFRLACREAGVRKSAHGLRKWFASWLAYQGATEAELDAALGWRGAGMAALYTRAADRERLGLAASRRAENVPATSIPAPRGRVRD